MISDVEHFFLSNRLFVFFGKLYSVPLPLFNVVFNFFTIELCEFFIYLDINPSLDIRLANTFSHSIGCSLILLLVYFAVQSFLV